MFLLLVELEKGCGSLGLPNQLRGYLSSITSHFQKQMMDFEI